MKIGTRSVLYGVHNPLIHTWFVAAAWIKLYGWPWDPRLWIAFFVHDLGYWGKPDMDGENGEFHPFFGAVLMHFLFGDRWFWFMICHSRFLAKRFKRPPSKLCFADKLSLSLTPWWLYRVQANLSGEIQEYIREYRVDGKYEHAGTQVASQRDWHDQAVRYTRAWVETHKDGMEDTWTGAKAKASEARSDPIRQR